MTEGDVTPVDAGDILGDGEPKPAPGGALGTITLDEFLAQCIRIGSLKIHDGAVVQNGYVGSFDPKSRYGQIIVVNRSGDALEADDVENHVVMNPEIPDVA